MARYTMDSEFACKEIYVQCELQHDIPGTQSVESQTAWIQDKLAVKGNVLKFKDGDSWTYGWKVVKVHSKRIGVPDAQKMIRNHRRATGDSEPKVKKDG